LFHFQIVLRHKIIKLWHSLYDNDFEEPEAGDSNSTLRVTKQFPFIVCVDPELKCLLLTGLLIIPAPWKYEVI